jgi:hypothetical protein
MGLLILQKRSPDLGKSGNAEFILNLTKIPPFGSHKNFLPKQKRRNHQ